MNNVINQVPYLRVAREFPEDLRQLSVETGKSYIDIANAVNNRTIGLFPTTRPALTGNSWFLVGNQRQQSFRQAYTFTAAGNIPHGINILGISQISPNSYGSYKDAANNNYGIIYASSIGIAGQVTFYITPNSAFNVLDGQIVITNTGAPAISNGIIVIEWLSLT